MRLSLGYMREILKQKLLWIAALGYFVDLYDLVLYGAVRVESLKSLGYQGSDLFNVGADLLNIQMAGMLLGGFFFGVYGDRRGRKEALFGSILLYSFATFLNAYVHDYTDYAIVRFIAGFGLAGELGAAITLTSEVLPREKRGLGSVFIAAVGFLGAVASSYISQKLQWQNAYRLGGALGFVLLATRMSVYESRIFLESRLSTADQTWGSLPLLFGSISRVKRLFLALLVGVPIWYVAGILSYFAPEFAKAFHVQGEVTAGDTIMMGYLGAIAGDIACGALSQKLQSRKKAILIFLLFGASFALLHPMFSDGVSASHFYFVRLLIGFGNGYSALLVAWVAEMFGTNLRTTASSAIANLMRASVIPISLSFKALSPSLGLVNSSLLLGYFCFGLAILSIFLLPETFARTLVFLEESTSQSK
ncbi:MAG: MFS transporter [Bdellovibrionales bacterium]|nr:MFS transporter [Bdellovibrionales bacterium]